MCVCVCQGVFVKHMYVCGIDVRGHLVPLLALVHVHDLLGVDEQILVGVDHHTEEPRICLRRDNHESE